MFDIAHADVILGQPRGWNGYIYVPWRNNTADVLMTFGAAVIELGIPLALIFVLIRAKRLRPRAAMLLGALAPLLLLYAFISILYMTHPMARGGSDIFYEMWLRTIVVYFVILLGGVILALIPKPTGLAARFLIGCAATFLTYFALHVLAPRFI